MSVRRSTWVAVAVGVVLVLALGWLTRPGGDGTPLDPRGTDEVGTAAMFEVVERLGGEVSIGADAPADADTIVVLVDRFDDDVRDAITDRVRDGARLVLFDLASPLAPVALAGPPVAEPFGAVGRAAACDLLDGVADRVESARWTPLDAPADATAACFPGDGGHGLVVVPVGDGEVAVTGAVDGLVNRELSQADHGDLAVALLAPGGDERVAVVWDATIGGDTALLDLLPDGLVEAFWVLAAAALLFALVRGRRLGPPVAERLPVRVPASELVLAIGDLLGRHGHREAAAQRLRADLRREVALALSVPPDTPPDVLVELLATRLDGDLDEAGLRAALLDGPVPDDAALVAVTASLARVRARLRRTRPTAAP